MILKLIQTWRREKKMQALSKPNNAITKRIRPQSIITYIVCVNSAKKNKWCNEINLSVRCHCVADYIQCHQSFHKSAD